jgi:hypothetical protein
MTLEETVLVEETPEAAIIVAPDPASTPVVGASSGSDRDDQVHAELTALLEELA